VLKGEHWWNDHKKKKFNLLEQTIPLPQGTHAGLRRLAEVRGDKWSATARKRMVNLLEQNILLPKKTHAGGGQPQKGGPQEEERS